MLTSKEIIERTGISRATLNNYIASGLVPRPQVLPPGPQDGAAPRIGYFPDDTIVRVETIQRLKQQGWSITRIAEHFAAHPPVAAAIPEPAAVPPVPQAAVPAAARSAMPTMAPAGDTDPTLRMWLANVQYPAYLVNDAFRLVWRNEAARREPWPPTPALSGSIFAPLLDLDDAGGRDALLQLHLAVARERALAPAELFRDLAPQQAARLEALYRNTVQADGGLVSQVQIPAAGSRPARLAYAVQFREGVLFAYAPADADAAARAEAAPPAPPVLTPVAIVVTTLQDAAGLWVKLTAQEYFELLNEVGAELDRIFRQNRGQPGRQSGEVLVCYFLPQADGSYFWNALAAAQQTRIAMRQVSRRWQARKSWDVELCMNIGIDEGQEWMGTLGAGELRVLGDAAERAAQMSRASRMGTVLLTRSLVGKLATPDRQRLTYGVRRMDGTHSPLLFTFARLADLAAPAAVPAPVADLAVAELLDLNFPNTNTGPGSAG